MGMTFFYSWSCGCVEVLSDYSSLSGLSATNPDCPVDEVQHHTDLGDPGYACPSKLHHELPPPLKPSTPAAPARLPDYLIDAKIHPKSCLSNDRNQTLVSPPKADFNTKPPMCGGPRHQVHYLLPTPPSSHPSTPGPLPDSHRFSKPFLPTPSFSRPPTATSLGLPSILKRTLPTCESHTPSSRTPEYGPHTMPKRSVHWSTQTTYYSPPTFALTPPSPIISASSSLPSSFSTSPTSISSITSSPPSSPSPSPILLPAPLTTTSTTSPKANKSQQTQRREAFDAFRKTADRHLQRRKAFKEFQQVAVHRLDRRRGVELSLEPLDGA